MKVAIMQPYFFPYIGYFQLIQAVDLFVLYDDVNYSKRGWVNRNYILQRDRALRITLEVLHASQNARICDLHRGSNTEKLLKTVAYAYRSAPYFEVTYPVIERCLCYTERALARFLQRSLGSICEYIGIDANMRASSELDIGAELRGQDRILEICEQLGARTYINAPGGKALYDDSEFRERGIALRFLCPKPREYRQFGAPFFPNLSIIDNLMFQSASEVRKQAKRYELSDGS